jgi:hypothetical protein
VTSPPPDSHIPGLLSEAGVFNGIVCLPMEYDMSSAVFHQAFTTNLMLVVPLLSLVWIFWRAYKLLSPNKAALNTVDLALFVFFGRLLVVIVSF